MSVPPERLAEHPFLAGLEPAWLERLAQIAEDRLFEPGAYLCRQGGPAERLHLVRRGTVALEIHDPHRGTVVVGTVKHGEVVGVSWLVPPHVYRLDARAVEATRTFSLRTPELRRMCEEDPRLGFELARRTIAVLVERLTSARFQAADLYAPLAGGRT